MRKRQRSLAGGLALTALGAYGCSAATDDFVDTGARGHDAADYGVSTRSEPLINANTTPQRFEVGKLHYLDDRAHPGCTATLIHRRFFISAAHCGAYPVPLRTDRITFTTSDGDQTYVVDRAWLLPPWLDPTSPNYTPFNTAASLNSDILIGRLAAQVSTSITPATIAAVFPADGSIVSIYGYGGFGVDKCVSAPDGNKRARTFTWGAPPYPVCGGDSGGPTFDQGLFFGNQMTVTGSADGSGSLVHMRERIYDEMRKMINWPAAPDRWLSGTAREGATLSTVGNVSSPAACEAACISNSQCDAWTLDGTSCALKGEVGRWVPSNSATSGVRPVVEFGQDRSTGNLLSTQGAVTPHDCAARCGRNPNCFSYVYKFSQPAASNCILYSNVAAPSANPDAVSGVHLPDEANTARPGAVMSTSTQASSFACATACSSSYECQSYTFTPSTGKCELKYATPATTVAVTTPSSQSGIKRRVPLADIVTDGTVLKDWYVPFPRWEEVCRTDCENDASCVSYNVSAAGYGEPLRCRLLSSVVSERGLGGISSGYKGLTFF